MNDRRDREVTALLESSALSALVSRELERFGMAWADSRARRVWLALRNALTDRRGAAVTVLTAASVAMLMQWMSPVAEPGQWLVPAAALLWAAGTLVRTTDSQ